MGIRFTDRRSRVAASSLVTGLILLGAAAAAQRKSKPPESSAAVSCRALADLGMDAKQSEEEFAEPPLVRVEDQLFAIGVNWDLKRFATRAGAGGRRRYILARLNPDTLEPLETSTGDAPYIRFGPSAIGLVAGDDQLFVLAGGQLSLVSSGLKLEPVTADLANTAGQVAIVHAGDLLAISGQIIRKDMRYAKLWVWNNHTHSMLFTHEFQLTQRALALAIDEANKGVILSTEDGVREMSYVDGRDRKIIMGNGANTWGFHCGSDVIIPRSGRYSTAAGYAVFDPLTSKARYWNPEGGAYTAGTCAGNSLVAIAYQFKVHEPGARSLTDSGCTECQTAYDPSRLPTRPLGNSLPLSEVKKVTRESIATYDLASGKGAQINADLPLEAPLASAWDADRQKLFVMTTGHVCSVELGEGPR